MSWPTNVMSVGEANDESLPLDKTVNTRLSRLCGLAAQHRVPLTLQGFDELTKNEKDELFKNSIQACIQYLEELKQKGKKVAMKIISHAWRTYKSKLMTKEDWVRLVERCELEHFGTNSEYMQWLRL
jgi:hypothetical protein